MNSSNDAIVICTERSFEWKSRLLVRSIRAFAGEYSSVRIVSYSPCLDSQPSAGCFEEFRSLDVETVTTPLNIAWPEYRLANKVLACAHAEQNLHLGRIAFVDSDQIVVSDLPALFRDRDSFSARPVDVKNIGVRNSSDPEGPYWDALYQTCGVKSHRTVQTTVCRTRIREYFDSGMFSVSANTGILTAWSENFAKVWRTGVRPAKGNYFVEQSCLSATVSALAEEISILPEGYNLPLDSLYNQLHSARGRVQASPVSLHYHRLLDECRLDEFVAVAEELLDHERSSWIRCNVKELRPSAHGSVGRVRTPQVRIPAGRLFRYGGRNG